MTVVEDEQPLSPLSRMMHVPCFNLCVLPILGFATTIDVAYFKKCLKQTFMHHPRASSMLVVKDEKSYDYWWRRTICNLDDHVIVPDLDPDMESPDRFVEDYTARIANNPFDLTKPLWEVHILNLKTSGANATAIVRIHHSAGDGVSLIALVVACAKKISDPESLPEFPSRKKGDTPPAAKGLVKRLFSFVRMMILMLYYTVLDSVMMGATILFLKDPENTFKGSRGIQESKKRYVHRVVNLDDVKRIKNVMNVTVNDVLLAVTQAGLSRYIQKRCEIQGEKGAMKNEAIAKLRIRIAIALNLRASASIEEMADVLYNGKQLKKSRWGNRFAGIYIPLRAFDDPLSYVRFAKKYMDKAKLSLQPFFQYYLAKVGVKLFGVKFVAKMSSKLFSNISVGFSNVYGPKEEIFMCGHPVTYIAPTVSGFPMELIVHYQSYAKKLIICLAANETLIPDPHVLLDCLQSSLKNIKDNALQRGYLKDSY